MLYGIVGMAKFGNPWKMWLNNERYVVQYKEDKETVSVILDIKEFYFENKFLKNVIVLLINIYVAVTNSWLA